MKIGITERGDAALDQSWRDRAYKCDAAILITKAPSKLGHIPSYAIVHCTITGYGGTKVEPNVRPWEHEIGAYNAIVDEIGGERCVLRIDPIIPTEKGIAQALRVFGYRRGRVRISFLDRYPHVMRRFEVAGMPLPAGPLHWPLEERMEALRRFPGAEVCAEPGIGCEGCVSPRDLFALGMKAEGLSQLKSHQRGACACVAEKTELLSNPRQCAHGCLYCYWK